MQDNCAKEFLWRHSRTVFELLDQDGSHAISVSEFEAIGMILNIGKSASTVLLVTQLLCCLCLFVFFSIILVVNLLPGGGESDCKQQIMCLFLLHTENFSRIRRG